jgi:prevent-host-death family protein
MEELPATEFKARCLELMDRVAEGRETYLITKRGRPVARLVPAETPPVESALGCMADQTEFLGDIETPLRSEAAWKALDRNRARQWSSWAKSKAKGKRRKAAARSRR